MKQNILLKYLLAGVVGSVGALADMVVDKSNGMLTVTSDISGTVIAKVISPNDEVVVNEKYEGNSFSWSPSGVDGAYRYDVRVVPATQKIASANDTQTMTEETSGVKSDYAGGIIEVREGSIKTKSIDVEENGGVK
ncbi:hypothetical protein ACLHDG_01850 [Sulfurovum sp. CS9]|uniref:hypothetical protein n=1 Tax=Sulfurovum sp. CS9 TaxID=3391146 RepID=UPI0039EC991B